MKIFSKSKLAVLVISIFLGYVVIFPQIQVKTLTPLDFDETLFWGRDSSLKNAIVGSFNEKYRFIPIRYLNRYFQYHVFGYNSRPYYVSNAIELGIIFFLAFLIIGLSDITGAFFLSVTLIILPQLADGFYRIGTAEPIFTIFVLVSSYFFMVGKFIPFMISFALMLLSKENALFIAPVFIIFSFFKFKKDKLKTLTVVMPFLVSMVLIVRSYLSISGERYFSQYAFDLLGGIKNFSEYFINDWPVFLFLIFSTFTLIIRHKDSKTNPRFFILLFITSLGWVSLLPIMLLYESYYLFPSLVLGTLAFVGSSKFFGFDRRQRFALFGLVTMSFLIFQSGKTTGLAVSWHRKQVADSALTDFLLNKSGSDSKESIYLINQSLQNINGSWLILSDFGKKNTHFYPSPERTWDAYQNFGVEGVNRMADDTRLRYLSDPDGVAIESPCLDAQIPGKEVTQLCGSSVFFRQPVCGWCVIK